MAEYIDRNLIEWYECSYKNASCKNRECSNCSHARCSHSQVMQIPPADVIERVEYEKLKEKNTELEIMSDDFLRMNEVLKRENSRLHEKVDKAIEEMEKTENTQEHTSYDGDINIKGAFNDGIEKALEILKRNIGE